jgi:hypothetical protein
LLLWVVQWKPCGTVFILSHAFATARAVLQLTFPFVTVTATVPSTCPHCLKLGEAAAPVAPAPPAATAITLAAAIRKRLELSIRG